jgi:transposase
MGTRRYSEQFKRDAVRLVTDEGYSVNAAASSVGVGNTTLTKWVAKYGDETASSKQRYASKDDELEALKAENRRLRMERDILKKAAAFFANDQ